LEKFSFEIPAAAYRYVGVISMALGLLATLAYSGGANVHIKVSPEKVDNDLEHPPFVPVKPASRIDPVNLSAPLTLPVEPRTKSVQS